MKQYIEITLLKPLGLTAEVLVKEFARQLPDYYYPFTGGVRGRDKDGNEVEVNTIGRWMFGVPGYPGAARIVPDRNKILIYYPEHSAEPIEEFVALLKLKAETEGAL